MCMLRSSGDLPGRGDSAASWIVRELCTICIAATPARLVTRGAMKSPVGCRPETCSDRRIVIVGSGRSAGGAGRTQDRCDLPLSTALGVGQRGVPVAVRD